MGRSHHSRFNGRSKAVAAAALALVPHLPSWAADIDIYGPPSASGAPNVVFLLDNTSNWSTNNQDWNSTDAYNGWKEGSGATLMNRTGCKVLTGAALSNCNALIEAIFYAGIPTSGAGAKKRPWEGGYQDGTSKDSVALTQGQVQLRALKLVLNSLVCSGGAGALKVNVGTSMIGTSGSTLSSGHATGFIRFAAQPLTGTAGTDGSSCKALIDDLNKIDQQITSSTYKAPSNANYAAPLYEIFKYFGGHSNPTLAPNVAPNGGSPIGATGYGPVRFSLANALDDPNAFTDSGRTTYKSPITAANSCGNNYIVLVGNTYPNPEANNGGPTIFSGIGYTPPTLSAVTSDTGRFADEWTYFLANTDVSNQESVQRVFTYTIDTFKAKPDADQGKLLQSMAAVGGIGPSAYLKVGGDLVGLVDAFKDILTNIAAVNSVFTATTLPVSTTTQGTFLNQIFVGMFRPDADAAPRWVGNLKQYQFGVTGGALDLVDKNGNSAVLAGVGLFKATAESFWTEDSVYFSALPSGTPPSASDRPDGSIVEKGGAAQQLRKKYEQGASTRNVKMLSGGLLVSLSTSSGFTAAEVAWIRGENNVATGAGAELFNGSFMNGATLTALGATGARHSIHGDVLHSRPVALNYGGGDVVVYYGANDGFLRAVDGNKPGKSSPDTAGQELWSFIAPEHYPLITRLRNGTPELQLPETNSSGSTIIPPSGSAPKSYAMDGPIGLYGRYSTGGAIDAAMIYPTMRRGGRSVYAINVKSKTEPLYVWKITGGTGSYGKLAQTWSMPKPVVFKSTGTAVPVLVMGGGYDAAEDANNSTSGDGSGKAIYIINGNDGTLIKELATDFSVPSDVTIVDVDGDGEPDRAYVADVRGGLYRVDFPKTGDRTASATWDTVIAVKIASLGGKVFFAPDVVVTKSYVAVLVGTGDREKPLLNTTADRFVMVKDRVAEPRATALTIANLAEAATVNNSTMTLVPPVTPTASENGCYINLATNGEKVINAPFTIAGATYFGTNRPKPAGSTTCSADLGEAYAYKFPLFCSVPAKPILVAGGGMLPSPVGGIVTVNVNGTDVKMPFIIGSGEGNSAFKPIEPKPPIPPIRNRQNWRIDNGNR